MQLLINDLSFEGQFVDLSQFHEAVVRIMTIRQLARQYGVTLYCHRNLVNTHVTADHVMQQAIQGIPDAQRRAFMQWIKDGGPFWDDDPMHGPDDYMECRGDIVTATAVGEAAFGRLSGIDKQLVSAVPSTWNDSQIVADLVRDDATRQTVEIPNHLEKGALEAVLRVAPAAAQSWRQLEAMCRVRCPNLTIAPQAFDTLAPRPFVVAAADRIIVLLDTLDRLRQCVDEDGNRTAEGHRIVSQHFSGGNSWFSDSSEKEKRLYPEKFKFRHPGDPEGNLTYYWHGKVRSPSLRLHISDPFASSGPVYVVYVGPHLSPQ